MGAPNFYSKSGKYFVVVDTGWDIYEVESFIKYCQDFINKQARDSGFDIKEACDDNDRSYYGAGVTCISISRVINGVYEYSIDAEIVIRSGYYTLANLDYAIYLYDDFKVDLLDTKDARQWEESVFDYLCYHYNRGFATLVNNKIQEQVYKDLETLINFVDIQLAKLSDEQLELAGMFSNGEAIYIKTEAKNISD